ncbi:MAG TPA: substrate-binding domain-containing protein [Bacteroidota bacterium]|nr:substrate-binding domain-containing protein [Bacteroidota bacterium]
MQSPVSFQARLNVVILVNTTLEGFLSFALPFPIFCADTCRTNSQGHTMSRYLLPTSVLVLALFCASCTKTERFTILSGSENETLEPLLQDFARENHIDLEMRYEGSLDIMAELQKSEIGVDAVWPASSLWISLGDKQFRVRNAKSIMISPVVFGIRESKARELGFVGRDVAVRDILAAIHAKRLTFMMTSASQSNSGASAYLGFLYALSGNPEVLSLADLRKPDLKNDIRELLSGINRSSGSSGWLKELFLKGDYDAMVNYESVIIETNQELVKQGRETLHVVYPIDGLVLADSPLGYISHGNARQEEFFTRLQEHLLTDAVQGEILAHGRRVGYFSTSATPDSQVFKREWGIQTEKILSPIKLPPADVVLEALTLYQTEFRKPSFTAFCLDFSGSMEGPGEQGVKAAMELLLDQEKARPYLLQGASDDIVSVIPFSGAVREVWTARIGDRTSLDGLRKNIAALQPGDGTDIYSPVIQGLVEAQKYSTEKYSSAIILMTDGKSNEGKSYSDVLDAWKKAHLDVPIFAIMFGEASQEQLARLTDLTRGKVFDGRKDLVDVFRKVKGYN